MKFAEEIAEPDHMLPTQYIILYPINQSESNK